MLPRLLLLTISILISSTSYADLLSINCSNPTGNVRYVDNYDGGRNVMKWLIDGKEYSSEVVTSETLIISVRLKDPKTENVIDLKKEKISYEVDGKKQSIETWILCEI